MTHAQMTADEWVNQWADEPINENPTTSHAVLAPIPKGMVVAFVNGGVYTATTQAVSDVITKHFTPSGTKLRNLLLELGGDDQETREFYAGATAFELALIVAWWLSKDNQEAIPGYVIDTAADGSTVVTEVDNA